MKEWVMERKLPLDELSMLVARIEGPLLTAEKVDHAVQLLAQAIRDAVPGTAGAGVSLFDARGRRTSSGSTDRVVEQADTLQYQLGQGPCLTAWAGEQTVIVDDVRTDARWPAWSAAVDGLPIRSVVSTVLVTGREPLGALKVYAPAPSVYSPATARLLELFAEPAATLLSHVQSSELPRRISERLQTSLHGRDLVNQACGILMERHGFLYEAALRALMLQARKAGTPLQQFSASIVASAPAGKE